MADDDALIAKAAEALHLAMTNEEFGSEQIHPAYLDPRSDMACKARRLAPAVIAAVRDQIAAEALRAAADYCQPENWTGPAATLIHLEQWLRTKADRLDPEDTP